MSELEFEQRVARALRTPVPTSGRAKHAIMEQVRRVAREGAPGRPLSFPAMRGARQSIIGIALAAGIGSITTMSALTPASGAASPDGTMQSVIIGDSVVDRLRDTLRLVRLIFADSAARQVSVIGDFNGWKANATAMRRDDHGGEWTVTLALHDGEHRYAIMVDNTRRAGPAPARTDADGQVYSLLHVARASN